MLSFYEKGVTLAESIPCMPLGVGVQSMGRHRSAAHGKVLGNCVRPGCGQAAYDLAGKPGKHQKATLALPPNQYQRPSLLWCAACDSKRLLCLRSSAPKGVHTSTVLWSSYTSSVCFSLPLVSSRTCAALGVSVEPVCAWEQSGDC